jgi:hypothetical protein
MSDFESIIRSNRELRNALFDEIIKLSNGTSTPAHANAMARQAGAAIKLAKAELAGLTKAQGAAPRAKRHGRRGEL